MEKVALQNALTRLKNVLDVVELATDASASIKKMIGKFFYCNIPNSDYSVTFTLYFLLVCTG